MAKVEKIALSRSQDIPFDKLVLSSRNVRRVQAGVSIEELADDIGRRSLLQSLSVRPIFEREGFYEVQAGGRRFRALELLVKQKRLAKIAPIPCVIREDGILEEDSLAENVQRVNLHPLDQFRAFQSLREQGLVEEEIAARFFVTINVVRQRLKLASVSPKLLEIYSRDEMSLEQLMSFTVSSDHVRQEQVWEAIQREWHKEPYRIKKLLTENAIRATDRRARFVGVSEYEAAGGAVLRDLFANDDGGWLQNAALLEKLVVEKLEREGEAIRAESWKWIEVATDFPYGHSAGLRRIAGKTQPLSEEERSEREALRQEMEEIEQRYMEQNEDLQEEADRRLSEIERALDAFENRPLRYDPAEVARAGVFVSIDGDGRLKVQRGYVRPEDEAKITEDDGDGNGVEDYAGSGSEERIDGDDSASPPSSATATASAVNAPTDAEAEEDGLKPLSDRLVMELTAHRTLALRNALAGDPTTRFLPSFTFWFCRVFITLRRTAALKSRRKAAGSPCRDRILRIPLRRKPSTIGTTIGRNNYPRSRRTCGRRCGHSTPTTA